MDSICPECGCKTVCLLQGVPGRPDTCHSISKACIAVYGDMSRPGMLIS